MPTTVLPAVRMSGLQYPGPASRDVARAARTQGLSPPPMLLDVIWSLPLHPSSPVEAHDQERIAAELRWLNGAYWQDESRKRTAEDQDQATDEYASGEILDEDQDGTLGSRFLYAFWRLCEQRIAAVQATQPAHSAQVVAARAGVPPDVRVVALRRAGPPGRPGRSTSKWHHHWWCACTCSTKCSTAGPS